jgi:hypothetical protein
MSPTGSKDTAMSELTAEQLQAAEGMTLEQLREAALKEAAGETVEPVVAAATPAAEPVVKQARDAAGRFTDTDVLDNKDEVVEEPATTIYRREIDNGNGSVDVYEAESLEELVEKLAVGKLNANKKIQEFIAEKRASVAQNEQVETDTEFMIAEKLKAKPKSTIKDVVVEVLSERESAIARSNAAQSRFVQTHPDYVADPENGNRLAAWLQTHGHAEITVEGLEKGYQDLKKSGLLKIKPVGAGDATEVNAATTQRTVEPAADATQQRSQRRGSSLSTRSGSRTTAVADTQPTEDEAYKMPLEKLRELANKQLADANRGE